MFDRFNVSDKANILALLPGFLAGPSGIRAGRALKSMADSRPKDLQFRLRYLRVVELQH